MVQDRKKYSHSTEQQARDVPAGPQHISVVLQTRLGETISISINMGIPPTESKSRAKCKYKSRFRVALIKTRKACEWKVVLVITHGMATDGPSAA